LQTEAVKKEKIANRGLITISENMFLQFCIDMFSSISLMRSSIVRAVFAEIGSVTIVYNNHDITDIVVNRISTSTNLSHRIPVFLLQ